MLRHASRLATIGEMTAGIAHELNQPLCAIENYAKACKNVVLREAPHLLQLVQWSEAIAAAAARGGSIVRRLLDSARNRQSARERVPIERLVDDAILLVRHEAQARRITLQRNLPGARVNVHVDPVEIQQVLVNVLRNAIEAAAENRSAPGEVAVFSQVIGEEVRVSVRDNGPGVSEADLGRLFAPLFSTKPQGLGLGLAISRSIVEDHGGRICATANQDGGLTIHFTLRAT